MKRTGLVLSGGGARGAYAVGVVQAIIDVLGQVPTDRAPFDIYSGTSVGSINTAYLVANAHDGTLGIDGLRRVWAQLDVDSHLKMRQRKSRFSMRGPKLGRSLLDPRPLELLVRRNVSFRDFRRNIDAGRVAAAMVAAFDIGTAQTAVFAQFAPGVRWRESRDPSRRQWVGRLSPGHILASSAMPFVFPARKLDGHFFCDGGVRFNTPISPAIRAGASRLVVISLKYDDDHQNMAGASYPSNAFLAGRLLNALLIDPFEYDLDVLERFNRLTASLEGALPKAELAQVHRVMTETRGAPYRHLDTLVFSPSEDLGKMANEHLGQNISKYKLGALPRYFLKRAAAPSATWEADWAAYLLFDGRYAERLMDLGYRDAYARRAEITAFFKRGEA